MKTIRNQLKKRIGLQLPKLRRELRTLGIQFFIQLQKEQQTDNKQKIKENLPENALEAVEPYVGTKNMFHCCFVEHRYCIMWPLFTENKQQLDRKEKNAKLCNICFGTLFEKNYFQSH